MRRVMSTSKLGPSVATFRGSDCSEAIKAAEEWAKKHSVKLENYYLQFNGRAIIVDYINEDTKETLIENPA